MKEELSAKEIEEWLIVQIAELISQKPESIDVHKSFADYGLSSLDAVSLSGDLEEILNQKLPVTLAYDHPSVSMLTQYLANKKPSETACSKNSVNNSDSKEAIAIVGMGCRFPGAQSLEEYWQLLSQGVDKISDVPTGRWDIERFSHPDPSVPGKATTFKGGFLDNIDQFDPFFFGISPSEAKNMDPQQRLLMELSYEALDDAGQNVEETSGSKTGVFIGISINEYSQFQLEDPVKISSHSATGSALSIAANRISYNYNFRGPSLAVDTACSSSLSAVHLACQSIGNNECDMALAGGVNLILTPTLSIGFTKAGVLAPDGKCKTFDASANGYARGEGGGVVVLKSLSKAKEDGDRIYAVIPGSAMVQDGRTNGLMAPSQESQENLLKKAYQNAGINPGDVQYIEAHGTGTLLGDSMEAGAIGKVIGGKRSKGHVAIGSVKTNFGHLEAASGMAGLIKTVLSIKNKQIPPSLNCHNPNPHIPFDELNLKVQQEISPWPTESGPAIAGASSFGFGGTNVHVVVREWEQTHKETSPDKISNDYILPLSASSLDNLKALAENFSNLLTSKSETSIIALCSAAAKRRSSMDFRLACVGNSREELTDGLLAFTKGEQHPNVLYNGTNSKRLSDLVFVFSGHGSQWHGMGRELINTEPVFSQAIEKIDSVIQKQFEWSVKDELFADSTDSKLETISKTQPMIFAIQVALAELWKSWDITPDAVISHSMGEVASAYIAGILSLEDAVNVICLRSQLLTKLQGKGTMLATELSAEQAKEALIGYEEYVSIAAINGPESTFLSGDPGKIEEIKSALESKNLYCQLVNIDIAPHSPQIDPLRPEMLEALKGLKPHTGLIPFYSTVTGELADNVVFNPDYWVDNLRKPVLFSGAVEKMMEDGFSTFIEVSPHPVLLGSLQQFQLAQTRLNLMASMRREESQMAILYRSLGTLYTEGSSVAWNNVFSNSNEYVSLPPISWNRQRYWIDRPVNNSKNRWFLTGNSHPLLGERIGLANSPLKSVWQGTIDEQQLNMLTDHRIGEEMVFPAAAYIEMAIQAMKEKNLNDSHLLSSFNFKERLILEEGRPTSIQTVLTENETEGYLFGVYSQSNIDEDWVLHATSNLVQNEIEDHNKMSLSASFEELKKQCTTEHAPNDFYSSLEKRGISYGQSFQGVEHVWSKGDEALGSIRLPEPLMYNSDQFQIHPALLDGCLQIISATKRSSRDSHLYVPAGCERIRFFSQPNHQVWSHITLHSESGSEDIIEADVHIYNESNEIVAELIGFRVQRSTRLINRVLSDQDTWMYKLGWEVQNTPNVSPVASTKTRNWLILADNEGLGESLTTHLQSVGDTCKKITAAEVTELLNKGEKGLYEIIEKALKDLQNPIDGIVHLWNLSVPNHNSEINQNTKDVASLACDSVLHLVQALAKVFVGSPKLWLVTKGVQSIDSHQAISVEQSPTWGLGKVVSFEIPELKCTRLDLDPDLSRDQSMRLLFKQLSIDDREDQIALRGENRYVLRLLPFTKKAESCSNKLPFRKDRSYLITGGLSGLGLATAKWMVAKGAGHLVLIGRSEPSEEVIQELEEIRGNGAQILVGQVDVCNTSQVRSLFEKIENEMPALSGIIHAAGLLDDDSLLNLDIDRLHNVMAPKVDGTWNLHHESTQLSLDFFVLYSSAVSVLGSPGQGNYTAANFYLDTMANYRQNLGLPAISINWGPWAEIGLAAERTEQLEEQKASTEHLVKTIKVDQGLEMLEFLMHESLSQVAVLPFDLKDLLELYPFAANMPFFKEVGMKDRGVARLYARPNLQQKYVAPRSEVELKMTKLWEQTLHIDKVGIHDSFFELGGDSVLAAQILAKARKVYGISINPQDAFKSFTIEHLADMLESEIIKQIEEMTDEEVQKQLSDDNI